MHSMIGSDTCQPSSLNFTTGPLLFTLRLYLEFSKYLCLFVLQCLCLCLLQNQKSLQNLNNPNVLILLPCDPTVALLGMYPKRVESLCPHRNLHTEAYCSFIHNYQNPETTTMFLQQMNEQVNCDTSKQWNFNQR